MFKIGSFIVVCLTLILATHAQAANFGGVDVTPTNYVVTLKKVEFIRSDNSAFVFAEGNFSFDIASATAGESIGAFAAGNILPPGTYTGMRITVGRSFGLTASTVNAGAGQPCRTATGNASTATLVGGTITGVGVGTTDGAAATQQNVPIPTGAAVTTALTGLNMSEVAGAGSDVTLTANANIVIPEDDAVIPSIGVDFNVTNAAELLTTGGGTCTAFPQPPGITITIGN